MARGSSAARQRAARGSGGLRRVVDTLIAETRAVPPWLPGRHAGRVTPGRVLRASGEAHPDLFWAWRGGGYFGVVTSFCYRLHPVTGAFGGMLGNSLDRADAPSPHLVIILKRMGGAAGRVPADVTPFW
jgi:FAD/FMN-containing dehydrogenase